MEGIELFNIQRIKVKLEAQQKEDAIRALYELMLESGNVKETFLESILAREEKFPTGLKIGDFGIAIPHTEPEHVKEAGIAAAVLKEPVEFQRMDDPEDCVEAKIIFMMALKDGHNHLSMISNIIKMLQNKEVLTKLANAQSEQEVLEAIHSNL